MKRGRAFRRHMEAIKRRRRTALDAIFRLPERVTTRTMLRRLRVILDAEA